MLCWFAVVAGEVRTLAQRSATAARDIKHLIEEAVAQVESGVVVATGTGKSSYGRKTGCGNG